jgi:LacI family transcriptional regulator
MKIKKSNIRDVASRAGVSIATVSRILNGEGSFNRDTILGVEKAVAELDYRRSTGSLQKGRADTLTIALSISDFDLLDPLYWDLVKGIYDTVALHSCAISLHVFKGRSDTGAGLAEDFRRAGAAGVIFVPYAHTAPDALSDAGPGIPVVFLDRTLPGRMESSVVAENELGGYQAARYLIQLGHRSLLYMGGLSALSTERDRRRGFMKALAESGLSCEPGNLLEGGFELHLARQAMRERLGKERNFSAIFASNDVMAFGVKEALDEAGLRVPEDLSLVGYDNIPYAAALGLTTISQPSYDMGMSALLLLLDHIQGRQEGPRQRRLSPSLLIRRTCGRAAV